MTERPLRSDARRNRARIVAAARELFAQMGRDAQMDEIAAHAGLGIGTLYRHFPTKEALLRAMVRERARGLLGIARAAEAMPDPDRALEALMRGHLAAADQDAAFQLAMMESDPGAWEGIESERAMVEQITARIVERARDAGAVSPGLSAADVAMLICGVLSTMYFAPGGTTDWRRHLEVVLAGLRAGAPRPPALAAPSSA